MKILKLYLKAFGPFSERELDLSMGQQGLHIIYGVNEAGKSSALRAIRNFLYGIPERTSDNFIHPNTRMRIGAVLGHSSGNKLAFFRRKGRKNTLRDHEDQEPVNDEILNSFLGAVDEDLFQTLFGIDHERLRRGGEEILRGGGKIGELLFSASGVADLRQRQDQLQGEIDGLFKAQGQNPPINKHLSELREARTELKRVQLSVNTWQEHEQTLHRLEQHKGELDDKLREIKRDQQRLNRIQSALPSLAKWKEQTAELKSLENTPLLPENFSDKHAATINHLRLAEQQCQNAQKTLVDLTEALQLLEVREDFLAEAETIEKVYRHLENYKKALQDCSDLETRQQIAGQEVQQILQDLGYSPSWDNIEALRIPSHKRVHIQELGDRHEGLVQRSRGAQREQERLQKSIGRNQEKLDQLGKGVDPSMLRNAVQQVQQQGDLGSHWNEQCRLLEKMKGDALVQLEQLPLWSGSLEALERLAIPSLETVERFENEFRSLEDQHAAFYRQIQEAEQAQQRLDTELLKLEQGAEIPSEAQLLAARQVRDQGWRLIIAQWQEGRFEKEETAYFLRQFPSTGVLVEAYRLSVEQADDLADRLRREADRAVQRACFQNDRAMQIKRHKDLLIQQENLEKEQEQWRIEWEKQWVSNGIAPLSPREMRPWLHRQAVLAQEFAAIRSRQSAVSQLQEQIEKAWESLSSVLIAVDAAPAQRNESLHELLLRSQDQLEEMQTRQSRYEQWMELAEESNSELQEAKREYQKAEQELSAWEQAWGEAMQVLSLEADASPGQASTVLTLLTDLFHKQREAKDHQARIKGIDEEVRSFQIEVTNIVQRLALDFKSRSMEEISQALYKQLSAAKESGQKRDSLRQQEEREQEKLRQAREAISQAQVELGVMCQQADCENPKMLYEAARRSSRRRTLEQNITDLEKQLLSLSGGTELKVFLATAEAENPDELTVKIEDLQQQIERLESERDEILQAIQHDSDVLGAMDGSAQAAEKAEECALLSAQLEEEIRELAVLRVASSLLQTGIERYREKNQGPILERASRLFAQLTLGSFAGLQSDFNDNGDPILVGVRPDGGHRTGVEGMSDGTCDQLYLALRIASLENWLQHRETIPFIIDDVLLNFDDGRAVAALQALVELSVHTQVIFFTHHEHLVELARRVIPEGILFPHKLGLEAEVTAVCP